jgi:hypothetical protein
MYRGGSGGEFLTELISKYSNKFRNVDQSIISKNTSNNRTEILFPVFFKIVSTTRTKTADLNDLILDIQKLHHLEKIDITQSTNEAISFLTSDSRPPLIRSHLSRNSYFNKSNAHTILIDTPEWYAYREMLLFLKTKNAPLHFTSRSELENIFKYEISCAFNNLPAHNRLIASMDWLMDNKITTIYDIHIEIVATINIPFSFADIFYKTPLEIFKQYNHINNSFSDHYNFYEPKLRNRVNIIEYSKLFNKDYLEDMFDIKTDEFHTKLIQWHNDNLNLITQNGFDIAPYIL